MREINIKQTTFYALQIIRRIDLEDENIVTSKLIAEKENLSQGVVLKLLREMVHTGIVFAHQGRGAVSGGFSMAKTVDEITLNDIVDALEEVNICKNLTNEDKENESVLFRKCIQINEYLKEELSKYTIRDLFEL